MQEKKLGLPSIVATGVGLIIATSCLLSIGQGASAIGLPFIITMAIACAFNMLTAFSICELNALMPNLTGGMAQYTLACFGPFVSIVITVGGYLTCQTIMGSSEAAMFGNTLSSVLPNVPIPGSVYSIVLILLLLGLNLFGVDMFAKVQNIVAYGLIGSLLFLGIMGTIKLGYRSGRGTAGGALLEARRCVLPAGTGILSVHRRRVHCPHFHTGQKSPEESAAGHGHQSAGNSADADFHGRWL